MRITSVLAVSLVVLSTVCSAQVLNHPQNPGAASGSSPTAAYPSAQAYPAPAQGYGGSYQPPSQYQGQPAPPDYSLSPQGDPVYPYPPHQNPYYDGAAYPRNMLTGAIEWVFSLPSYAMDGVSNFLDNNFFPRAPATSGGSPQGQPQSAYPSQRSPATAAPLPPANVYAPPSR
jgi:hypothetical protein